LRYLASLAELLEPAGYSATIEGDALAVTVEGTLKRSRRKITLHGYTALTDIFGPRPPAHWPILRLALARDPIVIHPGHSGLGLPLASRRDAAPLADRAAHPRAPVVPVRVPGDLVSRLLLVNVLRAGPDRRRQPPAVRLHRQRLHPRRRRLARGDRSDRSGAR